MPRGAWGLVCLLPLLVAGAPSSPRIQPVGVGEGLTQYRFEQGELHFEDILTLSDGARHLGKIVEWADQILLYDSGGGVRAFDASSVASFEFRRGRRQTERPALPDLTVAFVERLPRDPSWHGSVDLAGGLPRPKFAAASVAWHPKTGQSVTFRVRVLNAGPVRSIESRCRILIDSQEIKSAPVPPLEAGAETIVEAAWPWQEGNQRLRVELSAAADAPEIARWNNTFDEPVHALGVTIIVAADRHEAWRKVRNVVDTFCFEDWVQHQLRCFNGLLRASVYPSAPRGAIERVRCDRILVVPDPEQALADEAWLTRLRQGGRADGLAEYAALLAYPRMMENEVPAYSALKVDWTRLQRLGAELGLIDLRGTDTTLEQNMVLDGNERYVCRHHLFPWPETLMYAPGPFALSERCVGYLNQTVGRPRCFAGEFLYQLPRDMLLEILSTVGSPLEGVQVEAYQLHGDGPYKGTICGYGRDPLFAAFSDATGRVKLLNQETPGCKTPNGYELRPNPFGRILTDGSNGLLLIRLKQGPREEYYFVRLFDMNVAYLRGQRDSCVTTMRTRFAPPGSPAASIWTAIVMDDRSAPKPPLTLGWKWPDGSNPGNTEEFRVYKRTSLAGDEAKPWTLDSIVRKGGKRWSLFANGTYFDEYRDDGPYSLDTSYAVAAVDKQGREGILSPTAFLAWRKQAVKFAIDTEEAFITLTGSGPVQMLHWSGAMGTQPFGVRTTVAPRYNPAFAGVAITQEHRLVVSDPLNHVLAFYDLHGNLEEISPPRDWWPGFASDDPGEFNQPLDVAVDDQGRIYVADTGNHRVQILDSRGAFLAMLEDSSGFLAPHALGFSNGHLCVTDRGGTRLRVYRCAGEKLQFIRQLPVLIDADRGLVNREGRIIVTGRASESAEPAVLTYKPDGAVAEFDTAVDTVEMGKVFRPRGLYLYPGLNGDYAYFVNDFPFDVRRYKIEPNSTAGTVPIQ